MAVYTFVLDHAGGTYISQLTAPNEQQAFQGWIDRLYAGAIDGISKHVGKAFSETGEGLVVVSGLNSVWCASAIADDVLALVNVIRTEPAEKGSS